MDACSSACSTAQAVQDIPAGAAEHPGEQQHLEELNRVLAQPTEMLISLKQQQAGVQAVLWELEQSLASSRAAATALARGRLPTKEQQQEGPHFELTVVEAPQASHSAVPVQVLEQRRTTEEALEEVFHVPSELGLQTTTHTLLDKIRRTRRSSHQALPPLSEGAWPYVHAVCKNIVNNQWFECAISLVIVANSVLIGVESQLALSNEGISWANHAELGFLAIYTLEIAIRAIAMRWMAFRDGWFLFDFILVISSFVEQVISLTTGDSDQQIMILRLLRLFRLVRTFRMIKQIRKIWRLVYGLMNCGDTMLSAFALLGLVLYVFGVLGLKVISEDPVLLADDVTRPILQERFSSLGVTIMTLTQFVTLDSIAGIYLPLMRRNPWLIPYFTLLILIVSISLMNLVTATLVEAALEHARQEKEEEQKLASIATKHMLPEIVGLFDAVDSDGSGEIVIEEMRRFEEEGLVPPELLDRASVDSMTELFEQLDFDLSGKVNREEFIEGLLDIFLREVPVYSLQMMKMLRLVRESQCKIQAGLDDLRDSLEKNSQ